jgi:hypothetical protein
MAKVQGSFDSRSVATLLRASLRMTEEKGCRSTASKSGSLRRAINKEGDTRKPHGENSLMTEKKVAQDDK